MDRQDNGVSIKLKKSLQFNPQSLLFTATPLIRSKKISQILKINLLIKHDDFFEGPGGGSKYRKLKYILRRAEEQKCNAIITAGGNQSNHLRSTSILAAGLSMQVSAIIHDNEPMEYKGNLKLTSLCATNMSFVKMCDVKKAMDDEVINYIKDGCKPFYIWGGGHCVEGSFAYYEAVKELKDQLGDIVPDYIIHASGTGTTQAGLEIGVRQFYPECRILGISIARKKNKGKEVILESMKELNKALKNPVEIPTDIHFDDQFIGTGYESTFPGLLDTIAMAAKLEGIVLDPTYSGKAFHALTEYVKSGVIKKNSNVVFWHTGGLLNLTTSN